MRPIDFFWRAAQRWPANIAIDSPVERLAYRDLARRVAALAAGLVRIDPQPGSRVAICAKNNLEHIVSLLAVLACGKVWVPLNARSTRHDLDRGVRLTEPTIFIVDEGCLPLVNAEGGTLLLNSSRRGSASRTIGDLIAENDGARPLAFDVDRDAVQAIKFTGGTTGLPKGVMQPYRAWVATLVNQVAAWQFHERDRYVVSAPVSHGTSTYVLPILAQGGCHLIPADASLDGVLDAFRTRGGTTSFMPPTLIYMLMQVPGVSRADFPALSRLIYGAAPMPRDKVVEVRRFFGSILGTTFGQTEAPQIATAMRLEDFEDEANWASVGRATWFTDVAIVDPQGGLLPTGEVGEVVLKGDLVMTGYWRNPERTAEALQRGWLHTGDRGLIDERGFLFLKDRIKDMVITGGFNVYPVDVESALGCHQAVHECSVFGVPDDKWGEAVHAAVQLRPGQSATEAELIEFVKERIGSVQAPKRVHFYGDLPRSSVGKVLKAEARRQALEGLSSATSATSAVPASPAQRA